MDDKIDMSSFIEIFAVIKEAEVFDE